MHIRNEGYEKWFARRATNSAIGTTVFVVVAQLLLTAPTTGRRINSFLMKVSDRDLNIKVTRSSAIGEGPGDIFFDLSCYFG